jgi:hypothetical protein
MSEAVTHEPELKNVELLHLLRVNKALSQLSGISTTAAGIIGVIPCDHEGLQ